MSAMSIAIHLLATNSTGGAFAGVLRSVNSLGHAFMSLGGKGSILNAQLLGTGLAAAGMGLAFDAAFNVVKTGVDDAASLQMALLRVQQASGLTDDALANLTQAIIDLHVHSLYSTEETAAAFEKLSEMGFTASQTMYGMAAAEGDVTDKSYDATAALQGVGRQAMAVGEAMHTDAVTGATLLGSALHTFVHDSLTAADAANILVGAYYNGVPSAEALQTAINNSGAMADAAGISFRDFASTLGLLAQAGLPAEQAGTSLRYMIQSLIAPTDKQAKMLAYLGVETTNLTPYLKNLEGAMERQGGAAAKAAKGYDGSMASLKSLFTEAQKAKLIPLDETFNQWAEKNGLLNSKLFDSQGQFKGLENAVAVLDDAMKTKGMSMQQRMDAISQLFNVRSGRAAQILTNIDQFHAAYDREWDRIGKTDALKNAQQVLATFTGSITVLKSTVESAMSLAFMPFIQAMTPLFQRANDLVGVFMHLSPAMQGAAGWTAIAVVAFLGLATVITTIAFVVALAGTAIGGLLLGAIAAALPWILGVAAGIAALVGWFFLLRDTITSNKALMDAWNTVVATARQWLATLWSQVQQLWQQLQVLKPVWDALLVVLRVVAVVIGAVLVVAIFAVIGALIAIVAIVRAVVFVLTWLWQTVASGVMTAIGWIGQFAAMIADGMSRAQAAVHAAFTFIGNLFVWLYNHNYYIQALVDIIRAKLAQAQAFISTVVHVIQAVWTATMSGIQATTAAAWSRITGVISGARAVISALIVQLQHNIIQPIEAIAASLFASGQNAMHMLFAGLKAAAGPIIAFINDLAGKIAKLLGFHSPPKEGPLSDSDEYMPNMMKMFARGIQDHTGLVHDAISGVSGKLASTLTTPSTAATSALVGSGQSGTVVIPITLDGKQVAQYVLDLQSRKLKQAGMSRYAR